MSRSRQLSINDVKDGAALAGIGIAEGEPVLLSRAVGPSLHYCQQMLSDPTHMRLSMTTEA
jgi:hypothetical protein